MNKLLSFDGAGASEGAGTFTAAEITAQPAMWRKIWKKVNKKSGKVQQFLEQITNHHDLNIVLTGAGSSAFIGDVVADSWLKSLGKPVQAIPTTDLVTHFEDRVVTEHPLLLISFARSGNSPESKAAIDIANRKCSEVYHLIITCNPDGKLAKFEDRNNTYLFLLPERAEDKGLAMTNSFSSMALTAILIAVLYTGKENLGKQIDLLCSYGQRLLEEYTPLLHQIAQLDFSRAVFLGSGPLWGIAKESHLKLQELTNGQIMCKFDTFLGFRHGPKAIINDQTLLVYLLSNNSQTFRYERDLICQIARHDINLTTLGITEDNDIPEVVDFDIHINDQPEIGEAFWAILCVLPAQIIGFYKSLLLGYDPDSPSDKGVISRVVEGVTIYDESTNN